MAFPLESFLLVLARLSGLFLIAPIFSSRQIPVRVKIFVLLILAATMAYFVPVKYALIIPNAAYWIAALVMELAIGFTMGFVAYVFLAAIQLAGQIMDMQMGFGIVNVVDPQTGTQIPLMGNLTQALALLIYLGIDGHHYLLQALAQSYQLIPVLGFRFNAGLWELLLEISVYMFVIGVKIALPFLAALLTADVAMGFVARTVPQMNVFIVGLPLKILLGLFTLLILLPLYIWIYGVLFARFFAYLDSVMRAMGL
ncbi:flagellar biosynthetic protein FliR [Thermosyntropha lipolytica DSM 11003]|uniref:Flagellar biosynthetic protein FliR n=1 Tax=Thermosyntropha lipolytica DSM 11003 TaxID=1123382 RepID=A0A1M5L064_9FIRM|nr:flagellar biosynthetic protein FliR [Thermosyntropha lipolytica]SHG57813.1 flagellar biosynthetic protein FliR [Thermosyntropha lipolytica DSM 11003]